MSPELTRIHLFTFCSVLFLWSGENLEVDRADYIWVVSMNLEITQGMFQTGHFRCRQLLLPMYEFLF